MKKVTFLKFLFEDKEALSIWFGFFILTFFIAWIFFIAGIIIFIGLYATSFMNIRYYFKLKNHLIKNKIAFDEIELDVKITQKGFMTSGPIANRPFEVKFEPVKRVVRSILTEKGICFFPFKKELGIIRIFLKPIVIKKNVEILPDFQPLENRICNFTIDKNTSNLILDCKSFYSDIEIFEVIKNEKNSLIDVVVF